MEGPGEQIHGAATAPPLASLKDGPPPARAPKKTPVERQSRVASGKAEQRGLVIVTGLRLSVLVCEMD